MLPWLGFIFTMWFFAAHRRRSCSRPCCSCATHFDTFSRKLPAYHEFFSFKTVIYLWVALGVVKVIHEFGHGLSCKAFGGEVHEMGLLFLVLLAVPVLQRLRRLDAAEQVAPDHHQRRGHLRRADHRRHRHLRLVVHADAAVHQQPVA